MKENVFEFSFEAFGTYLQIKIFEKLDHIIAQKIQQEVLDYTSLFDSTYSRFKENSLITKISNSRGIFEVPTEFVEMLRLYEKFYAVTKGSVNPLIGNTLSDLGYDANYTLRPKEFIRPTPKLDEVLKIIGENRIETTEEVIIDIGALGKGFWVDKVSKILDSHNCKKYFVNGSGDIFYKNSLDEEKLVVGLEGTDRTTTLYNNAICGSGTNKRNWSINESENLHHIVDARTGMPTNNYQIIWVKAKTAQVADGLASALFFVAKEELKKNFEFEYMLVKNDGDVITSSLFDE
jgi:thiamine biosynthesis lipoprotein